MLQKSMVLLVFLELFLASHANAKHGVRRVYLAGKTMGTDNSMFSCHEKVYAFTKLPANEKGRWVISTVWFGPAGEMEAKNTVFVDLDTNPGTEIYSWLDLDQGKKTVFDEFSLGGDYGKMETKVNGVWSVEVWKEDEQINKSTFSVICE